MNKNLLKAPFKNHGKRNLTLGEKKVSKVVRIELALKKEPLEINLCIYQVLLIFGWGIQISSQFLCNINIFLEN